MFPLDLAVLADADRDQEQVEAEGGGDNEHGEFEDHRAFLSGGSIILMVARFVTCFLGSTGGGATRGGSSGSARSGRCPSRLRFPGALLRPRWGG